MYRLLLLVFLCNALGCFWHTEKYYSPWEYYHHRYHHRHHLTSGIRHFKITFENLADEIIKGDDAYWKYCAHNNNNVQEIYGEDSYELIYSIPGFTSGNIKVQVKHRVIGVYGTAKTDNNEVKSFSDIRVLSDILNVQEARWILEDEKIKVIIPYKINFNEIITKKCGAINREIITIPKQPEITPDMIRQSRGGHKVRKFSPNKG